MAINIDEKASIFNVSHYSIIGNICKIIPSLIEKLNNSNLEVKELIAKENVRRIYEL